MNCIIGQKEILNIFQIFIVIRPYLLTTAQLYENKWRKIKKKTHWKVLAYWCMFSCSVMSDCDPCGSARLLCLWTFPDKNTGVGCHFLLQGISWPRDWSHISCIEGRFFSTEPPGKPLPVNTCALNELHFQELRSLMLYERYFYQVTFTSFIIYNCFCKDKYFT